MSADPDNPKILKYRSLDAGRNEIRVLSIRKRPKSRLFNPFRRDLVECSMEYVSLDDYSPEYAEFLRLDGSNVSPLSRAILWDYITSPEDMRTLIEHHSEYQQGQPAGSDGRRPILGQAFGAFVDRPVYHDKGRYNEHTNRWAWGDFIALSYEWGDMSATREIVVDGEKILVSENLDAALRSLRRTLPKGALGWRKNFIWVDAICINQSDTPERNAQVKRMKHIYTEAASVFIWTGPKLRRGRRLLTYIDNASMHALGDPERFSAAPQPPRLLGDGGLSKGIIDLATRTYWARLWVIQEMLLANTSARVFLATSIAYYRPDSSCSPLPSATSRKLSETSLLLIIRDTHHKYTDKPWPDLMALLQAARNARQRDDRDKIYAILGLMDPEIQALVAPDYNAPVSEVYHGFVVSVIKATRQLEIIYQAASSATRNSQFPSWVPDWSLVAADDTISATHYGIFRAAGDTRHTFVEEEDGNHLTCRGILVDTIEALGCSGQANEEHDTHDVRLPSNSSSSPDVYGGDDGLKDAIWESFMLGKLEHMDADVAAYFRGLPWFNGAAMAGPVAYYHVLDRFQQCNKTVAIAGKTLEEYFPPMPDQLTPPANVEHVSQILNILMLALAFRRFIAASKGYIGMAPKAAQPTDRIFILEGCKVPVVLRPAADGMYTLVGECYLHGVMYGEALDGLDGETVVLDSLKLC